MRNLGVRRSLLCVLSLLLLVAPISLRAQTSPSTGAIVGVVKDPSGALVPNATVTLINTDLSASRAIKSASDGTFTFPLVQPDSNYEVDVEAPGFQKLALKGLTVRVTQVTTAQAQLTLGSVSEEIVVTSAASPVDTANATLGETLGSEVLTSIPLSSRSVVDLLATDAGVAATLPSPASTILQGAEAIFVGGNRSTSNNYTVNGIDANNFEFHTLGNGIIPVPNPDAVQELRTQTSLYDATTSYSGGGNISLITRSGTTHYHGNLYEYFRNDAFNANDFFLNRQGKPRPILKQNQFGGSFGGPVPKLGKTFFFFNYEGGRQRNGIAGSGTGQLPVLPAQRTAATLAALYQLPVSAIDPVAIKIVNAPGPYGGLLLPSGTGPTPGALGDFAFSAPVRISSNQYNARIDHDFNIGGIANHIDGSAFINPDTYTDPGGASSSSIGQPFQYLLENDTFALHDTQILTPNLLNDITAGFTYNKRDIGSIHPLTIADLGITRFNSSVITRGPNFGFADQLSCCGASASVDQTQRSDSRNVRDIVSYSRGAHTFRFGGEVRTQQFNFGNPLDPGTLSFNNGSPTSPNISDTLYGHPSDPNLDISFRDFLVGAPINIAISSGLTDFQYRAHDFGLFVQDDFHATSRLTLNLGLRWDYLGNITEKHDNISNFDPSRLSPQAAQMGGPGLQAAFITPSGFKSFGTPGVSKSTLDHQPLGTFAPRLGFAYDVFGNGKLAVRGGYGTYFSRVGGFGVLQTLTNPPFALSTTITNTSQAQILANPFPTLPLPNQFPIFTPFPTVSSFNSDGSPNFSVPQLFVVQIQRDIKPPYTEQWNLTTEYEFLTGWTVQVGYLGSHGVRLQNFQGLNNALLRNTNNPGPFGITTNSSQNREVRVPVVGVATFGLSALTDSGASFYDALLLTVSHQFSKGLFLKAAYTFSKSIDNVQSNFGFEPTGGPTGNQFLPELNRGLSNFDVPHRFVLVYSYNLPSPKLGWFSPVLNRWTFSGITTLQSGFADEVDQFTSNGTLSGTDGYGVVIPGCKLTTGGNVSAHISNYLNKSCAAVTPTLGPGQTFGPLSPFEAPGNQLYTIDPNSAAVGNLQGGSTRGAFFDPFQTRSDMALQKGIPLSFWGEGKDLQFRVEAFKVFNTPIFSGPHKITSFNSFGTITSTTDKTGRQLQLALRINF